MGINKWNTPLKQLFWVGRVLHYSCVIVLIQTYFRSKPKETQLRASNKNAADKHQSESSSSSCDSEEDEDLTRKVPKFIFTYLSV